MTPWLLSMLYLLALCALAAFVLWRDRRASAARAELAEKLHEQALRLDRRCDHLQHQVDTLERLARVARLAHHVEEAVSEDLLSPTAAARLRDALRALEADARRGGGLV